LKSFTTTFYFKFYIIKEYLFKYINDEINILFRDIENRKYSFSDFNLMLEIMKTSTYLKTTIIIRKQIIRNIWIVYKKVYEKYSKTLDGLIEVEKDLDINIIQNFINTKNCNDDKLFANLKGSLTNESINKLKEDLDSQSVEYISKSIFNFIKFRIIYAGLIKELIYNDEGLSWNLEHLLRKGTEKVEIDNQNDNESIYNNDVFKKYNDEFKTNIKDETFKGYYINFIFIIYLENATILRKSLETILTNSHFQKEIRKGNLSLVHFKNVKSNKQLKRFINYDYNFKHFRNFNINNDYSLIIGISYLKFLINESEDKNIKELQKFTSVFIQILSKLLNADKAFFTIKKFDPEDKEVYSYSKFNIDDKDNLPFVLDNTYLTYGKITDTNTPWYAFFHDSPTNIKKFAEHKAHGANDIFIIRFVHQEYTTFNKIYPIGCLTFLFNEPNSKENRVKIKNKFRYLCLIKNEIEKFLEANFSNNNFSDWIGSKEAEQIYKKRFLKFYHGTFSDIRELKKNLGNKNYENAQALSWIVETDAFIGKTYNKYLTNKFDKKVRNYPVSIIFKKDFRILIEKVEKLYDISVIIPETFNDNRSIISKIDLKRIILEFIINLEKRPRVSKPILTISVKEDLLIFESNGVKIKSDITEEKIINNLNSKDVKDKGIGLFTINKYIYFLTNKKLDVKISHDENLFIVYLPLK
jgi:hypothetical protein